jgi:catechol 2,3-dioxygenase-like lactoylglutathione lyase family enzyme
MQIDRVDFVRIPSRDAARLRSFYVETLGLRPDERSPAELWVGATCFALWEPEQHGMAFSPQTSAHPGLHVEDVEAACAELGEKGVEVLERVDTGVCRMAFFRDPDGNVLMLHDRYAPYAS